MNPHTGEIIAMSARPTFDPNDRQVESPKVFSNPLVEDAYEMGSIIKALSMAIGLETKAITPDTTYKDEGVVMMNGKAVRNVDSRAYGTVDMQTVLNKSLNTGIAFVMTKVGREEFSKRMLAYGLGKKTGIDLPVEQTGLVGNLSVNRDLEYANAGFGQGISMTPVQAIRALATLANGGKLVTPHILKKIEYQDGTEFTPKLPEPVQVLSTDTADTITKMLVNIVDVALRNGTVKMPRYTIAAKTGTAQIADPATKRYYTDRYLHSFFGYFPAYDPKFIVLLYQVNPKGAAFAAETLTGPFMDTAKFLINYYELPPDR
jgi:cell division protein FtsI/penicillin-binding protein 2